MKITRIIGWILLALAVILASHEGLNALEGGRYHTIALGELWYHVDQATGSASLNFVQAIVQRYIWAWLWDSILQPVLIAPAWLVFGIPGVLLVWLGRERRHRGGIRRH